MSRKVGASRTKVHKRIAYRKRSRYSLVVLTALVLLIVAQAPAGAEALPSDFGIYLTGRERPVEFLQILNFRDLPAETDVSPILRLAAQGVMRGDGSGSFRPTASVSRQEALVALVRLLGLEQEALRVGSTQVGGTNAAGAAPWAQGYIKLATDRGLTGDAVGSTRAGQDEKPWSDPATREEVAAWAVRALEPKLPTRPLAASAGLLQTYADADQVTPELKPLVELALVLGLIQSPESAAASAAIPVVDPKGRLTRLELVQVLDRLRELTPPGQAAAWQLGTLSARLDEAEDQAGRPIRSTLWEVTGPGGSAAALKLTANRTGEAIRGVVVLKEGVLSLGEGLQVGDNIRYLVTGNGVVPFVEVLPDTLSTLTGVLEEIDPTANSLALRDGSGRRHQLILSYQTFVAVAGQAAGIHDLVPGQPLKVRTLGGTVWEVQAEVENAGFSSEAPPRLVNGKVRSLDQNSITLVLPTGETRTYTLTSGTQVLVGGRLSDAQAVQPGDQVRLQLPDSESEWVERLEVAGRAGRVAELYRGRLGTFSPRGGAVVLTEAKRLEGDSWQDLDSGLLELPISADATLWVGQQEIDLEHAARLVGWEVYAAVGTGFGRAEAFRVLIKEGQEKTYEGKVKAINPAVGELKLAAGEIALSPGAIIMKEGRLADAYALTEEDSVQTFVEKRSGGSLGLVVTVLGHSAALPPVLTVYKGRVDEVGQNAWILEDYYTLEDNEWDHHGRRSNAELGLSRDTAILSLLEEDPVVLNQAEFRQGYHQDLYDNAIALAVAVEEEETLALALWPEEDLGAERLTAGRVANISEGTAGVSFSLAGVRDYSVAKGEWQSAPSPQELKLEAALVIKEGRATTWEALAAGDEVQVLRRGQNALLVLVKE